MKESTDYAMQAGGGIVCLFFLSGMCLWKAIAHGPSEDFPEWFLWSGGLGSFVLGAVLIPVVLRIWRWLKRTEDS